MNLIVTAAQVRDYLTLNSPGSTSRYSDDTIGSNIRAAQSALEAATGRFVYDHPGVTWATTTMLQGQVAIPGFRALTSVTWGRAVMNVGLPGNDDNAGVWAIAEGGPGIPDGGGLYVALQFRAWRSEAGGRPWWFADSGWFDKALDSPFYPGNYGGGFAWTSMPNDLVIVGDGGYTPGSEPEAVKHAVKVLAAWYTMRPASIMADVAVTSGGQTLPYQEMPPEVRQFIAGWKLGEQQAVSVG